MAPPTTIPQLFFHAIDTFGTKRAALRHVVGSVWHDITHHQLAQQVHHVAIGLRELGIESGDRLAILSDNRPEWVVADYACMNLGAVDVAIYPTSTDAQIRYLLHDSGAVAIFVENEEVRLALDHAGRSDPADSVRQIALDVLASPPPGGDSSD